MQAGDKSFDRLRAALEQAAVDDAAELVAEARAEARVRVRTMLRDALADSMLEHVREQLELQSAGPVARQGHERPSSSAPAEVSPRSSADLAWYVYGVVEIERLPASIDLPGVDAAHGVTTIREGELAAAVSQIQLDDFDEARLREHLSDPAWIEQIARAHERVIDEIRRSATVIPMRMCTVYRSESGVREMLRRESEALAEALAQLQGKTEWGVKVFFDLAVAARLGDTARVERTSDGTAADGESDAVSGDGAGAAYMGRRSSERERHVKAASRIERAAGQIHERLCAVSAEGLLSPSQRADTSGHNREMILNGAYLVEDETEEVFHQEVQALQASFASHGLELEKTGPWPAYNFVPGTIGAAW